jgi:CDP-paratose 2-epimerase
MGMQTILAAGSCGLIGSEVVEYFDRQGDRVIGVHDNMLYLISRNSGAVAFDIEQTFASVTRLELGLLNSKSTNRLAETIEEDFRIHPTQRPRWTPRAFSRQTKRARECR